MQYKLIFSDNSRIQKWTESSQVKTYSNSRIFLVVFIHLQMIYTKLKRISKIGEKTSSCVVRIICFFIDSKKKTM